MRPNPRYAALLVGLQSLEQALSRYGHEEGGSFLFGGAYTLAEALTAPFVVRMEANFGHHRGVDLLAQCERGGFSRAGSHCRFVPPLIHFTPDSLTYSAPLFLKRPCDRSVP